MTSSSDELNLAFQTHFQRGPQTHNHGDVAEFRSTLCRVIVSYHPAANHMETKYGILITLKIPPLIIDDPAVSIHD
jgi:hypothetical protein